MRHDMHEINGPGEFEREFGAMLHQAGGGFQPDSQALAEGGLRRGKVRLWRRRAAMVTGAAAVAAVAVAAVQLPGGGGGEVERFDVADTPETESELVATLTAMLPQGLEITHSYASTPAQTGDPNVAVTLGEGRGAFTLDVSMLRWQAEDWRAYAGCAGIGSGVDSCEETELEDGSVLTTSTTSMHSEDAGDAVEGGEPGSQRDESDATGETLDPEEELLFEEFDYRSWEVMLESSTSWGPGVGGLRQIYVSLSSTGDGAVDPGAEPPLAEDQLVEIAQAPVWQQLLAAADAEHGAPEESVEGDVMSSEVPGEELWSIFRELAPGGVEILESEGEFPGSASFEIREGEASARVDISAWDEGFGLDSGPSGDPDCEVANTLEDGSLIYICEAEEARDLFADVYYPNGASIDFTVIDEGSEGPLTADELAEIASNEQWQALFD
ncbi:hypothetical protein [Streptomyces mayteni]